VVILYLCNSAVTFNSVCTFAAAGTWYSYSNWHWSTT